MTRFWLLLSLFGISPLWAEANLSARLFQTVRPSVVEVRLVALQGHGEGSLASGFLVQRSGWVATNYHAVAEALVYPDLFRVEVKAADGRRIPAAILAFDVNRDLAVLKLVSPIDAPLLVLETRLPVKGQRGYSLGNPMGVGHSIVDGTFNGISERSAKSNLHFTGGISPGMSGGPGLDARGRVVGINVARNDASHLVTFMVPAEALLALLARTPKVRAPDHAELWQALLDQLAVHSDSVVREAQTQSSQSVQLGPFKVLGKIGRHEECLASREEVVGSHFHHHRFSCFAERNVYVADNLNVGLLSIRHEWLHAPELNRFQLARAMTKLLDQYRHVSATTQRRGRWQCTQRRGVNARQLPIQLYACRQPYLDLPGFYEHRYRAALLPDRRDGLLFSIRADGFSEAQIRAVLKRVIDAIEVAEVQP